jgi:polysaccharide pyruvyl transferase WcaK-like protein
VGRLWASTVDRQRVAQARSAALLVGGYDGSGNYGDVLQLATAIETVRRAPGAPLPVVVVEREMHGHHRVLLHRYAAKLADAAYVHYQDGEGDVEDDLLELSGQVAPKRSVVYVYGGGFLNQYWGGRKADHVAAAERLAGGRRLPLVASGLQVDEPAVAAGGVAHELLSRASWIGVRDAPSLGYLRAHLAAGGGGPIELSGDDALPFLHHPRVPPEPVVNLHLNDGVWVSDDPDAMAGRIVALLRELGRAFPGTLRLQPVIAYEDPRVSERRVIAALLQRYDGELERAGFVPALPLDLLEDAVDNRLAGFRGARMTIACSYHVTLSSLLTGTPAILLADNEYYEQKATGLRDLLELDAGMIGVRGTPRDAVAAVAALVDGADRFALVEHLRMASDRVVERFERGRAGATAALAEGLQRPRLRDSIGRLLR